MSLPVGTFPSLYLSPSPRPSAPTASSCFYTICVSRLHVLSPDPSILRWIITNQIIRWVDVGWIWGTTSWQRHAETMIDRFPRLLFGVRSRFLWRGTYHSYLWALSFWSSATTPTVVFYPSLVSASPFPPHSLTFFESLVSSRFLTARSGPSAVNILKFYENKQLLIIITVITITVITSISSKLLERNTIRERLEENGHRKDGEETKWMTRSANYFHFFANKPTRHALAHSHSHRLFSSVFSLFDTFIFPSHSETLLFLTSAPRFLNFW